MLKSLKKNRKVLLVLASLIITQVLMMVYFANKKAGYFVDEVITFETANYDNAPEGTAGYIYYNTMEQWLPGSFFADALTASGDGRFDFSIAYKHEENNAHPPLYHFLIHLVSSFFPGILSKWIGLMPNIIFSVLTMILLFRTSETLFDSSGMALIVAAAWGLSVGCMSTAVFIRMYAMLTLECIAFVWLHLKFFNQVSEKHKYLPMFLCTVVGILTQYYFLIFAFFFCGCFSLFLLIKKFDICIRYVICECAAVLTAGLLFPKMWSQVFFKGRGAEAVKNMKSFDLYFEHLRTVCSIISKNLLGHKLVLALLLLVFMAALLIFLQRHLFHWSVEKSNGEWIFQSHIKFNTNLQLHLKSQTIFLFMLLFSTGMYLLLTVKVAPYQTDRYYMCIYPMVVLLVVWLLQSILSYITNNQRTVYFVVFLAFFASHSFSYYTQPVGYVYANSIERIEKVSLYQDYPLIILNGATFDAATDIFAFEYQHSKAVFRCTAGDYSGLVKAADTYDLSDGFLLYSYLHNYRGLSNDDVIERVNKYLPLKSFELLTEVGCSVFFCVPEPT